jgi:assimilatory nitrate reductase catalytic subunit
MNEFVTRMKDIQARHGQHGIAYLSTGQICTEEMAFAGRSSSSAWAGCTPTPTRARCMATAHVAYKQSFGFDAPPYTYADFEESDVLVFVGANPCIAHPIMRQRVLRNPAPARDHRAGPAPYRDGDECDAAPAARTEVGPHLALRPSPRAHRARRGEREFVDAHTNGFDAFAQFIAEFTPERACAAAKLARADFDRCVELIANGKRVSFWWTMGVNQGHESTRTAQAIINLALMTGNIGRPGTGANSITGQCNAMGSRLFANATSLLGGRDFRKTGNRETVAQRLGVPVQTIPAENCVGLRPDRGRHRIRRDQGAVDHRDQFVAFVDPPRRFNELIKKLDFLVVQDLYHTTDTAQRAHLILPAAGWGEKEGTLINSERRLGLVKKVLRAPGEALSDFAIFQLIAAAWGCGEMFREWRSPEAAFQILKRLSAGQPCDITGIRDYRQLNLEGGIRCGPCRRAPPWRTMCRHPIAGNAASLPTAGSTRRMAAPSSSSTNRVPWPSRRMPNFPSRCSPGAAPPRSGTPTPAPRSRTSCGSSTRRIVTWRSIRTMPGDWTSRLTHRLRSAPAAPA